MAPAPALPGLPGELLAVGSATLGESGAQAMRARISAAWPGAVVAGPAFTASCAHGDNLAIHVAVASAPPGTVIVAESAGDHERGYWGEVLTTGAEARGLVGLVIDAGVRDTAALAAHGFPVYSAMVALPGCTKDHPGAVGGPVRVGDVRVRSGDWVVGDRDGVVVVPKERLGEVLRSAQERTAREQVLFDQLRSGRTTVDLLGLDAGLVRREGD